MSAITLDNITKTYNKGKVLAVDKATFDVAEGETFGLIGPDGAGKTSIFRVLTTLLLPDGGSATVAGFDVVKDYEKIRNCIGYMPGRFSLYQDLTVEENLNFFATIFNTTVKENYKLIEEIYVQIEPFKTRRAGKLSGGMKQKLALCCALIHKPRVLFLDEPTTGVDAVSRVEFWDMLKRLKHQGISILVSTPYMDEAALCDRIALIEGGKLLSIASPADTIKKYPGKLFAVKAANMHQLLKDLRSYEGTHSCFTFGDAMHVSFKQDANTDVSKLTGYLTAKGHKELEIAEIPAGIEDYFIRITEKEIAEK
jgi:ABC-type multidrug transport system ATPase subunit